MKFQVENWRDVKDEMAWLYPLHNKEYNKSEYPLNLDIQSYDIMPLHIVTARDDKIVGYHWSVLMNDLHCQVFTAYTDSYYLHPDYRKGFNGINFLKFVEQSLKDEGVKKVCINIPECDISKRKIFDRLGWKSTDLIYEKVL